MPLDTLALQVIVASTRKERKGPLVGDWFMRQVAASPDFTAELVDLAQINLPMLDEPKHPRFREYAHDHTKAWSALIDRADAFVFVTPEYNYSAPPSLINALDYLAHEWAYKPVGFVSYGGVSGGTRSVQMLKQTVTALKMMPMMEGVAIPFFAQFISKDTGGFDPGANQEAAGRTMLKELARWTRALKPMRTPGGA